MNAKGELGVGPPGGPCRGRLPTGACSRPSWYLPATLDGGLQPACHVIDNGSRLAAIYAEARSVKDRQTDAKGRSSKKKTKNKSRKNNTHTKKNTTKKTQPMGNFMWGLPAGTCSQLVLTLPTWSEATDMVNRSSPTQQLRQFIGSENLQRRQPAPP